MTEHLFSFKRFIMILSPEEKSCNQALVPQIDDYCFLWLREVIFSHGVKFKHATIDDKRVCLKICVQIISASDKILVFVKNL